MTMIENLLGLNLIRAAARSMSIADMLNQDVTCRPRPQAEFVMTQRFSVTGMTCQHCVQRLTDALSNLPGVTAVKVMLSPPEASVATREEVATSLLTAAAVEAGDFQLTEIN